MPRHNNNNNQAVLRRIKKELLEVDRLLQIENYTDSKRKIQSGLRNIERIRNHLRNNVYDTLRSCTEELLIKCEQASRDNQRVNTEYISERQGNGKEIPQNGKVCIPRTHNQRVERLWRDIHHQVISTFYKEFTTLEKEGNLDIENNNHMFVLQFMYLDVINIRLNTFLEAWNRHRIRTMGRKTPRQLWISGMLANINSDHTAVNEVFNYQSEDLAQRVQFIFGDTSNEPAVIQENNSISRFTATANLNEQVLEQLQNIRDEAIEPLQKYLAGVRIITF
ncbi:hypothetical protein FQR65_LT15492 [Abscondita terminalis]|nr:hypothetical protein FQR65_LT15492 [Abscondita terminalis]